MYLHWATNDSDVISAHLGYRLSYHDDDAIMPFLGYHDDGVIMPSWAYRMEQDGTGWKLQECDSPST